MFSFVRINSGQNTPTGCEPHQMMPSLFMRLDNKFSPSSLTKFYVIYTIHVHM